MGDTETSSPWRAGRGSTPARTRITTTWAVHHQRGAPAIKLVKRAVATAQRADSKTLQDALIQAILNMLDGELRKVVHKMLLDFSKIPEGPVHKYVREQFEKRGRAQGEAEALLRVLAKRDLAIDDATRERVLACTDETTLDRWIDRAVTATSAAEVFREPTVKPAKKKRTRRSRAR